MVDKLVKFGIMLASILVGIILLPVHLFVLILNDISNCIEAAWIGLLSRILIEVAWIMEDEYIQATRDALMNLNSKRFDKRISIFKKIIGL